MRLFGRALAALGLIIGIALGAALVLPLHLVGASWLIAVGLAKLTFLASLGLIGAGAVLQRLANREERAKLSPPNAPGRH